MKILMASSEGVPFFKTGGLGDVLGSLPLALQDEQHDVRVMLPLYSAIDTRYRSQMTFLGSFMVPLAWRMQYCGVFSLVHRGIRFYFLDNEYYFKRPYPYGQYDDAERFAFFSKAVLEALPHLNFVPDILHCHDWMTGMIPVYMHVDYAKRAGYRHIKTVFTVHNIQYQGIYGKELLGDVFGLDSTAMSLLEFDGALNMVKGALECAHAITTVSPTYAQELKLPYYAHGLAPMFRRLEGKLHGIVNGIDLTENDPAHDAALFAPYQEANSNGKRCCKASLQRMVGLPIQDVPLLSMVSRLVGHKGFDLLADAMEELVGRNVQLVVLGTGDAQYEQFLREMAQRYPQKISAHITFSNDLAKKIYSGADYFLMPSRSEPCGLAQMIAMRYGTLPIVRRTGGLADTVVDATEHPQGNGFCFTEYHAHAMMQALDRALAVYNTPQYTQVQQCAMQSDFSWNASAAQYQALYRALIS